MTPIIIIHFILSGILVWWGLFLLSKIRKQETKEYRKKAVDRAKQEIFEDYGLWNLDTKYIGVVITHLYFM